MNTYLRLLSEGGKFNVKGGLIEYADAFVEKSFSEEDFSVVLGLKDGFDKLVDGERVKPVKKVKCEFCEYKSTCFG